jgi:hypothetical protein
MSRRFELRARYISAWYEMDAEELLSATRADFVFDDPAERELVTKAGLPDYMIRWQKRANGLNDWNISHLVRQDTDGILTDWEWWEVIGTDLCGSALVLTSDEGVFLERITYFKRQARK